MGCFHNFTAPLWELFSGNALFLLCSLFYLVWWIVSFRPGASAGGAGSLPLLACAFAAGIAAMGLLGFSIQSLARQSRGVPIRYILLGCAVLYLILLAVTAIAFRRPATSELLIMLIWAAAEFSVVSVLAGTGRLTFGATAGLAVLVTAATIAGLACYMLYYRLGGMAGYRDGMIPLATDALVMAVFLAVQAFA